MTDAAIAPLLISAPTGPAVTTERYPVRVVLVATAVVFLVLFLLLQRLLKKGFGLTGLKG